MHELFNETIIIKGIFRDNLRFANIKPVFKKDDSHGKTNHGSVSVLPTIFNIYEKLMQHQMNNYKKDHLSLYLCGYREGSNTLHKVLSILDDERS